MIEETLHQRGTTRVVRLRLAPGEAMRWHRDPFHRVAVVLSGDALALEFRDGSPSERIQVSPGQVDWEEPSNRVHRAVNVGNETYEQVTVFFLSQPNDVPQPDA